MSSPDDRTPQDQDEEVDALLAERDLAGTAPADPSIDDALEADRAATETPGGAPAGGEHLDSTRELGADDLAAADQGNRDEDEMTAEDALTDPPATSPDVSGTGDVRG